MKKNVLKKIISTALITCSICIPVQADWNKDASGKWTWTVNGVKSVGWKNINNKWYYFNADGTMRTGWLDDGGKRYCFADDGHMFTGWIHYSKKWYYMDYSGAMKTGWFRYNNQDYYLGEDGVMQTGSIELDGKTYIFNDSGALINTVNNVVSGSSSEQNMNEPVENLTDVTDPTIFNNSGQDYTIVTDSTSNNTDNNDKDDTTEDESAKENIDLEDESLGSDEIRTEAPEEDNKYYYSDDNIFYKAKLSPPFYSGSYKIVGNCTWYAWGRIFELTGKAPNDAKFTGNAYEWWQANKTTGKYTYGDQPKVGALAVWKSSLPGSGGCGHVAVVEKIEDNKIYISESAWHGSLFNYREIYSTDYLYGYIYIDEPNF